MTILAPLQSCDELLASHSELGSDHLDGRPADVRRPEVSLEPLARNPNFPAEFRILPVFSFDVRLQQLSHVH